MLLTHRLGTRLLQVEYRKGFDGSPEIDKIWLREGAVVQTLRGEDFPKLQDYGFDLLELSLEMEEGLEDGEED